MRRAWPSALVVVGGIVLVLVGLVQPRKPDDRLFACNENMDCEVIAVLGADGGAVLPWYLAGVICFLGAGQLYWARKS